MNKEQDIWWWLTASHEEITAAGLDTGDRVAITGHARALSTTWAKSVGLWYLEPARAIMRRTGTDRFAYNNFRLRHGPKGHALQAAKTDRNDPYQCANVTEIEELAEAVYASVDHVVQGLALSVGEAARAVTKSKRTFEGRYAGVRLLPVEAVLYHQAIAAMLSANELTIEEYLQKDPDTRDILWHGHDIRVMTRAPGRLFLEETTHAAEAAHV